MNRRTFLVSATSALLAATRTSVAEQPKQVLKNRIADLQREMMTRRAQETPISVTWLTEKLRVGLTDNDLRIAGFKIVRNVPYKLTAWTGDPGSLFNLGRGDCRHKSAALIKFMRECKLEARPVQVPFDWADLPIPKSVLEPLAETRGMHDTVEVKIEGLWKLVDPTWDMALAKAGFPVQADWNGLDATLPITPRATTIVRRGDLKAGTDLYAHFGIKWPERERTLAFNRAFNAWTDTMRTQGKVPSDAN